MANVTFTANPQPAPACYPSDVNGMLQLAAAGGLSGTVPDNAGGGVFVGSSPPSSSLTNKVWYKTDGAGRPLGVYMFYNGNWRKIYTGVSIGEIRQFIGSNTLFDGAGRGLVGGDLDGWQVCNGNNGAPNWVGYQLTGGHLGASVGQPDGWFANAENPGAWVRSGGAQGPHKIAGSNLPQLLTVVYGTATAATPGTGAWHLNGPTAVTYWWEATSQNSPNNPMPFEPYVVVAFIMFIGYQ
jgi:hypothetical protein